MTIEEFSDQFDLLYNNITSNQAPGLTEYEKSVFLTKAEKEIVKNYFSPQSKGNTLQQGFDDSAKRQADFSMLLKTDTCTQLTTESPDEGVTPAEFTDARIDDRSTVWTFPTDVFIVINETITTSATPPRILQIIPLRYDEYARLMSKPYKRPLKNQAWRLINSGTVANSTLSKRVEIVLNPGVTVAQDGYKIRYIKTPKPIILGDLDGLTIDGYKYKDQTLPSGAPETDDCEIDPILHEDILQRAVELAKIAWTATGQDNAQMMMAAGQRSE